MISWSTNLLQFKKSQNRRIFADLVVYIFPHLSVQRSVYEMVRYEQMEYNKLKEPVTSSNQGEYLCEIFYKKFTLKNCEIYKECMTGWKELLPAINSL